MWGISGDVVEGTETDAELRMTSEVWSLFVADGGSFRGGTGHIFVYPGLTMGSWSVAIHRPLKSSP
jgi:hypothetical protein